MQFWKAIEKPLLVVWRRFCPGEKSAGQLPTAPRHAGAVGLIVDQWTAAVALSVPWRRAATPWDSIN
jgi:hypothetical protein